MDLGSCGTATEQEHNERLSEAEWYSLQSRKIVDSEKISC